MADHGPMAPVEPEIVAVFVKDQKLSRKARRQDPFPFGHHRFSAADHAENRISVLLQFAIKSRSCLTTPVFSDAVDLGVFRVETGRQTGITSDQVDKNIVPVRST